MTVARILLLLAVTIWGWTFVATKVCLRWLDPLELLALRFAIAVPALGLLVRLRGIRLQLPLRDRRLLVGAGIFTVHFIVQVTGLQYTSATNTGWIIAVIPLILGLLAWLLLGERLGARTLAGIAVATVGILILVSGGRLGDLRWLRSVGDWLVLISAHTWALYTVAVRDVARARDPLLVTFAVMLPGAVLLVALALLRSSWQKLPALPLEAWAALLFLGLPGMALAQWFWQIGVSRIGAARSGLFLYLEPLATTALAVPYLHEPFGTATVVGGSLVLLGVGLGVRSGGDVHRFGESGTG